MTLDRSNLEFQLNGNQSFHRLDARNQAILTNTILGNLREIEEKNGNEFVTVFREKADQLIKVAEFDRTGKKGYPLAHAVWKNIHKTASFLATRQLGLAPAVDGALMSALKEKNDAGVSFGS